MNEIIMVDHLIRLNSAFGDKKWLENSDWLSRLPSCDIASFYNSVRTEISHIHNLGNSQEVLSYFDVHSSEYLNLDKRLLEYILGY